MFYSCKHYFVVSSDCLNSSIRCKWQVSIYSFLRREQISERLNEFNKYNRANSLKNWDSNSGFLIPALMFLLLNHTPTCSYKVLLSPYKGGGLWPQHVNALFLHLVTSKQRIDNKSPIGVHIGSKRRWKCAFSSQEVTSCYPWALEEEAEVGLLTLTVALDELLWTSGLCLPDR